MATFEIMDQASLIPAERLEGKLEIIDIDKITFSDIGPPPTPQFILSIRQHGVLTPITLMEDDETGERVFVLIAGRRRVKAALQVGMTEIPALIFPIGITPTLALIDHAHRHANPAADLRNIEDLLDKGYDEKRISVATGMTVGTIRSRLKLAELPSELRDAFDDGKLSLGVANDLTKLSAEAQTELAIQFEETGTVTALDVKKLRRVQRASVVDQLDFDTLAIPVAEASSDQPVERKATLDEFIGLMGLNQASSRDLATVGIACYDTGRWEDVREILQRILELRT